MLYLCAWRDFMAAINKDPHQENYEFLPQNCVTALFKSTELVGRGVDALRDVGFGESDLKVFAGEQGVQKLDIDANKQSTGTQILQAVTKALADDGGYLERAVTRLREGGAMVRVEVGDDERLAQRASSALKAQGGEDVQYWGDWVTEQL
jgi:hypothetical protein